MKTRFVLYLVLIAILSTSCTNGKQSKDSLPCIDVRKNYPEKEIILTDIADITYLHLNSDNDNYLYKGGIRCLTKNTIVVYDESSGNILFFTKGGKPKSYFNRKGQGPEEYINARIVVYDEVADDVFVLSLGNSEIILVYSATGEYKRKLVLPKGTFVNPFVTFDDESLFVYNAMAEAKRRPKGEIDLPVDFCYEPFIRVSKADGKMLDIVELPINDIVLRDSPNGPVGLTLRLMKCTEGLLLCNPETDTIFLYSKNKTLTPVICKTPLVNAMDPMVYMNNCADVGSYQFMAVVTVRREEGAFPYPIKYYMREKKTGEIFRQKITLPDYTGKEFFFPSNRDYENGHYFELDLIELKEAYNENRLSGKLKELVATLNEEEDNNVFMFVHFK